MKITSIALLAASLTLSAGTASAMGNADRAEQLRRSAEINLPLNAAANPLREHTGTPMHMNAAEARAAEFRSNTDMMRPQTFGSPAAVSGDASAAMRTPDDRAAAEMMKRTDMMKPN